MWKRELHALSFVLAVFTRVKRRLSYALYFYNYQTNKNKSKSKKTKRQKIDKLITGFLTRVWCRIMAASYACIVASAWTA
jgi:hypothetical protein